jgi:ubiquinone/menaquinone biosynthesis C-methylase UbiE
MTELTARQKREKEYYDQYSQMNNLLDQEIDLSPILKVKAKEERRPWNSYWSIYEFAINFYQEGMSILDFGSGPGENALRLSHIGYQVHGFDISDENIKVAKALFEKHGRSADFQVATAEALPYGDESIDIIVGIDILHHIDIPVAIKECYRVLKKGGKAYFREPIEVPLLDRIRNTWLVKLIAPKDKSFDNHITHDERKLNALESKLVQETFEVSVTHHFDILSRFDKFIRSGSNPKPSILEKIDHWLMTTFPFMRNLGGTVIYELTKK